MSRQRRESAGTAPYTTVARGGARDRLRDAGSKELATLARKLGNDRVQSMLAQATGKRDGMLEFIRQRLAQVKVAQEAERKAMSKDRVWFDEVARGKTGWKLPDPTRWRGPAALYKKAIQALCAGDLGRGAQLLDKAVEAERAAFDSMPVQVAVPSTTTKPEGGPDVRPFVEAGEGCTPTQAPEALAEADAILRVSERSEEQHQPHQRRPHVGWWDQEAEGDEKKEGKKGAAAKAPDEAAQKAEGATKEPDAEKGRRDAEARDAERAEAERAAEVARVEEKTKAAEAGPAAGPPATAAAPKRKKEKKT